MSGSFDEIPVLTEEAVRGLLPQRPRDSHKGKNGRALLCVGSGRYTGAALLCAAAALRAGCGLLEAAVPGAVKPAFSELPEAMCTPVNTGEGWDADALKNASALLPGRQALGIGSGMGACANPSLLLAALQSKTPLVLDADGLNLLSRNRELFPLLHENVILTPHPGEMARLTELSQQQILNSPGETAAGAAAHWGCIVLLKGYESHIAGKGRLIKNVTGNPGLSKGGSGDVLAGLIVGLLAQGLAPFDAASIGAYLLGASADRALSLLGSRMLMATDVTGAVAGTLGQIRQSY